MRYEYTVDGQRYEGSRVRAFEVQIRSGVNVNGAAILALAGLRWLPKARP
ncbi:MAG: hypothetical protein U9Q74_00425 [Gemmatimonadota bacterium]|nr:hypothetical protein [Gemmatimonadota bacterium]